MDNKWQLCVCGVLRSDDKYLLVQRNPQDEDMAGFWEMPSGKAEFGEKIEQSLIREVYEEIGINISNLDKKIIGISEYSSMKNNVNKYSVQLNYLIEIPKEEITIKLSEEHVDYAWVTKEDSLIDSFIKEIIDSAEVSYPPKETIKIKGKRK